MGGFNDIGALQYYKNADFFKPELLLKELCTKSGQLWFQRTRCELVTILGICIFNADLIFLYNTKKYAYYSSLKQKITFGEKKIISGIFQFIFLFLFLKKMFTFHHQPPALVYSYHTFSE